MITVVQIFKSVFRKNFEVEKDRYPCSETFIENSSRVFAAKKRTVAPSVRKRPLMNKLRNTGGFTNKRKQEKAHRKKNNIINCLGFQLFRLKTNKTPAEQRDISRPKLFYNYIKLRLKNSQSTMKKVRRKKL